MCCCVSQFITLITQHNPKLEGCSGALGRSLCQDREGPVSSLWSDGWSNGAKLWSKPNVLKVSRVKFSEEPSCSPKQPGLVAVVQLCGSQLLPATVLDRWTAIALLSALSIPQLFFSSKLCGTVELNTIYGWWFLKNLLSFTLPRRSLSCCHLPLLSFPLHTELWPRAGHFTEADFSQAPQRPFYQDSH